jgi:SPP1 gp7 family putative phage head morphogenesis protein
LLNGVKFNKTPVEVRKAVWQRLLERGIAALRSIFAEETDEAVTEALDELWQDDEESAAAYLETVARTAMFESMNEARYAEFSSPEMSDFILALEYSSVLDDRTTEVCQYMDGRVYSSKSEVWNRLRPPNHYNCRSVLIPITQTDLDEGTWNGRESPPPAAEPQVGFK